VTTSLETAIDFHTPELKHDSAPAIAEDALTHVRRDSMSIVLDSVVDIADSNVAFKLRIFLVPDPGSFVHVVDQLELDRSTAEPTRASPGEVKKLNMSADEEIDFGE